MRELYDYKKFKSETLELLYIIKGIVERYPNYRSSSRSPRVQSVEYHASQFSLTRRRLSQERASPRASHRMTA